MTEFSRVFTQNDYNAIIGALDGVTERLLEKDMTEEQAKKFLVDFVSRHYFEVWRPLMAFKREDV